MDFGHWEGLSWPDIESRDAEVAAAWQADPVTIACPGGEHAGGFCDRASTAMQEVLAEYAGRNIAVFGHAGTNRAFLSMLTGLPYMETFVFAQDYGCLNAAAWDHVAGHGQVALVNLVPGPRSAAHGDGGRRLV
jgi:broad specificity phosphatase PhoE